NTAPGSGNEKCTTRGVADRVRAGLEARRIGVVERGGQEVRSALEWAQVRALAADGVPEREIARRLRMNRRTVARLARSEEPPRYQRASAGSKLDRFEPVLRRLVEEWPQIKAPRATELLREEYGYDGSVDLVKRRLRELRPRVARPAQRTGYRPGQVLQLDWAEMPTRPVVAGAGRRVYALIASLPYSGAQTAVVGRAAGVLLVREEARGVRGGARAGVRVVGRGAA